MQKEVRHLRRQTLTAQTILPPPSPGTVMQEALEEQFATIDYTFKATNRAAAKLFER